ncbi:MAG: aminoglycoside phosphotransferase, partial [Bacillota bacterium]|nr:aminoglycoside phosphotransferase [Bacillota bacterium]
MLLGKLIGRGNTAEVYELTVKNERVIKLFYERIPLEYIKKEFETSIIINQLGIPSPTVEEFFKLDKKWGIVYEKIVGRSFTQVVSSQPFLLKKNALLFAELQASFHGRT